jgi:predicted enzyme related to lactoylglutathione lyase
MKPAAVVYAKDRERLSDFYVRALGFTTVGDVDTATMLESALMSLTIVQIPPMYADDIVITVPPTRREETPIKLVFEVTSIADARRDLPAHGGEVDPLSGEWDNPDGSRVCNGIDPEGNVILLRSWPH